VLVGGEYVLAGREGGREGGPPVIVCQALRVIRSSQSTPPPPPPCRSVGRLKGGNDISN